MKSTFMEEKSKQIRPLVETTAEHLVKYIIDNDLKPCSKLPNEYELAKDLSIGRSTVREAIKLLAGRNILEVRQGAGTFLVADRIGIPDDPLGFIFIRDKKQLIKDLMEVRMMIEPRIASLAAASASDEDIDEIRRLCNEMDELINEGKNYSPKDVAFHAKIAMSSGNSVIPRLLPILQEAIPLFANTSANRLTSVTMETHHDILRAIEAHDPIAASDAMTLHLIHNRNLFLR
jgi:GntR family transcriptional repressor for pyruvate dehydrogenase complex